MREAAGVGAIAAPVRQFLEGQALFAPGDFPPILVRIPSMWYNF
jgi:hypothetical protein